MQYALCLCAQLPQCGGLGNRQSRCAGNIRSFIRTVALQHPVDRAGAHIPPPQCLIIIGTCKHAAVGTETHGPYPASVALQCSYAPASLAVPEPHHFIIAATGQDAAIRAETDRPDTCTMPQAYLQG